MYLRDKTFKGMPRFQKHRFAGFGQTDPNLLPCSDHTGECPPSNWDGRGLGPRGQPTQSWPWGSGQAAGIPVENPPESKFGLFPHWVVSGGSPLPGLTWPQAQEKYRNLNLAVKNSIESKLAQAGTRAWGEEIRAIYNDLMQQDAWVRERAFGGPRYVAGDDFQQPDVVLYSAYKKAARLVDSIAPGLTEEEEAEIVKALQPPSMPSEMMDTRIIDGEGSLGPKIVISPSTLLLAGGGLLLLVVGGFLLLK